MKLSLWMISSEPTYACDFANTISFLIKNGFQVFVITQIVGIFLGI